ncbi:MAG: amidohydrolase family protein, partial [Terracidiphilus sp.]
MLRIDMDEVAMRIITLEEHITTPAIVKAVATGPSGPPPANPYLEALQAKLLDLGAGRLADMDAAGISVQVLSQAAAGLDRIDPSAAEELARDANDRMAEAVKAHPDRLAAFATLAPQKPEKAAAEFERCIRQLGFKGGMVNGTTKGLFLDHAQFAPL